MANTIQGADSSHWQGHIDYSKFPGDFCIIKVSQGIDYADDMANANALAAKAHGKKIAPYHFFTTDTPTAQYNWFMQCLSNIKVEWDLPAAADYEYYNPVSRGQEIIPHLAFRDIPPRKYQPHQHSEMSFAYWTADMTKEEIKAYGLVIPSAAYLYTFLTKLKGWNNQAFPKLYTNPSTANANCINSTIYDWSQWWLWIANWNVPIPNIPKAWKDKGKTYAVWQDRVIRNAQDWGVDGDLDHDLWGDALPFPSNDPYKTIIFDPVMITADGVELGLFDGKYERKC